MAFTKAAAPDSVKELEQQLRGDKTIFGALDQARARRNEVQQQLARLTEAYTRLQPAQNDSVTTKRRIQLDDARVAIETAELELQAARAAIATEAARTRERIAQAFVAANQAAVRELAGALTVAAAKNGVVQRLYILERELLPHDDGHQSEVLVVHWPELARAQPHQECRLDYWRAFVQKELGIDLRGA